MLVTLEKLREDCEALATAAFDAANKFLLDNPFLVFVLSMVAAVIAIWVVVKMIDGRKPKPGFDAMARKAHLDEIYAYHIHEFMFALYCKDKISRQEYRRDLQRFGLKYDLPDIVRKRVHPKAIRIRVLKNIASNRSVVRAIRADFLQALSKSGTAPPPVPVAPSKRKVFVAVVNSERKK